MHRQPAAWLALVALVLWAAPAALAAGQGYGPGRIGLEILAGRDHVVAGTGGIWNSRDKLHIQLDPADGWRIRAYHVDLGGGLDYSPPLTPTGNPKIGHFDYKETFTAPYENANAEDGNALRRTLVLDLAEDLGFQWGSPWAPLRLQGVAVFLDLVKLDAEGRVAEQSGAWVVPELLVWIDAEIDEAVSDTAIVAEATTGEVIDDEVAEVKQTAKGKVRKEEHQSAQRTWEVDEAEEVIAFDGGRWGWWFRYVLGHPKTGHFIDSPVAGLHVETPTYEGVTGVSAAFDYFPGEEVEIALGSVRLGATLADHKISPLDIFPAADTEDARVINLARLLQSLDADGQPQGGIVITPQTVAALEQSAAYWGLAEIDFADDLEVENVITRTIELATAADPALALVLVSAEDAKAHLDDTLNNVMFRKNVAKTPELGSAKAKMDVAGMWFPARRANNDTTVIEYYDENGALIRTATRAKPIVVTYTDEDPVTGAPDVWAAISRDDGETWKRKNLSRAGDRSSFTTKDGTTFYGDAKKPVFQMKGNKILIAWSSKYARGGRPAYAIDPADEYVYDDPYYTDDIWGVAGPQRSHDYTGDGYPEVGEVPYSAVWTCRGVICTQAEVDAGLGTFVGEIIWFKPERLTSGRRDANQIFCGAASGAGFALVWQEDPEGLRPGRAVGPGPGWGGATTAHKTDIWYSYLAWGDHSKVDANFVINGDPEHPLDTVERPKALVPMSLPVRLTDNDVLNTRNMGIDELSVEDELAYTPENLTRCVKFEGGKTITTPDDPDAWQADYTVLRAAPADHLMSMNCVNCHVPYGTEPHGENPTQASPIPLVVVDADADRYLGGFTNDDCVSCHYSHVVPRDRVIAVAGATLEDRCADCEAKGGVWKDGSGGGAVVEAYYPYTGYPYIYDDGTINDGTHRYGLALEGLLSGEYYTFINHQGAERSVAITSDGRLLDGDTGASRPNIFLQPYPYTKPDGTTGTSAWAFITYEETKGAGSGPPDETGLGISHRDDYVIEAGKNVIYHSFDFRTPDLVAGGTIMNLPECVTTEGVDEYGNPIIMPVLDANGHITPKYLLDEAGNEVLDFRGRPQLAYENARRGRFLPQGWGAVRAARTPLIMAYKEGIEGSGRPTDIMLRRWVIPAEDIVFTYKNGVITGVQSVTGNPYRVENIVGDRVWDERAEAWYWANGVQNMSSVTPTVTTPSSGDPEHEDAYGAVKVVEWIQTEANLADLSGKYPYDDARAHRGLIRGDFIAFGMSYCPNWAASRNGHAKYDFFMRRSFDGGATWTTDPAGAGVTNTYTWTYPSGTQTPGTKVEVSYTFGPGEFEAMRNLTQLPNNKESIIEPRLVGVPGTIKVGGVWTGIPEDKQDPNVFWIAWGTSDNPIKDPVTKEQDEPVPADLYWTFSRDRGESMHVQEWVVNPDSDGPNAGETVLRTPWLAKGAQEQGECQIRMTPDGSRFYASWLDEGDEGSDIVFRRIMPLAFPQNQAAAVTATAVVAEPETGDDGEYDSGTGGDTDD
ncbi:MAG: choice-of-anchor O protein [Candidatus Krumholzibacteriia bacterium]